MSQGQMFEGRYVYAVDYDVEWLLCSSKLDHEQIGSLDGVSLHSDGKLHIYWPVEPVLLVPTEMDDEFHNWWGVQVFGCRWLIFDTIEPKDLHIKPDEQLLEWPDDREKFAAAMMKVHEALLDHWPELEEENAPADEGQGEVIKEA